MARAVNSLHCDVENGYSKADMKHWDTLMNDALRKDKSYTQSWKLREEIYPRR